MPIRTADDLSFLLRTLGAAELCEVTNDGLALPRLLGPGKPLALLAYCCCDRNREHSRDFLASLLWSDADPARARQSLRQALWRLRSIVGDSLRTRDDAVLGVDARVTTDRDRFLAAVHRGDAMAAVEAYGGPFLAGLTVPGGDEFEDWAAIERRHLEESLLRIAEPMARQFARNGRPSQARELVERMMVLAPDSLEARRIAVEVLLDAEDRAGARRAADALDLISRSLGGRAPATVEALVARARHTDAPAASEQRMTTIVLDLVGREETFGAALGAWTRARAGETQVVVLSGVAGIGKSRLLAAIAQRCATKRTLTATVRANPGERDVPFGFAAAIARSLATLPGAAGVSADSAREIVALDPGLGSQFATTPSLEEGGEAVRRRALALLDLLSAIVEQEPLSLFLDDLHWADVASRQLLSIVLGRATDLRLMVVTTTRGSSATMFDQRTVTALPLLPLTPDELVDAIRSSGNWPESADAARFVDMLASVCEGIPLSIMERLALVRERGLLELVDGEWESPDWTTATREIGVASPLDHRLAACADIERAVLLTLSVAGTPLREPLITRGVSQLERAARLTPTKRARTVDLPPALAALELLEVKGLVVRAGESWLPNHDVVAERTLALSSPDDRHACHVALAGAYAELAGSESTASAVRHYLLAGDDGRAGQQFARVAARARSLGDRRPVRELLFELTGERLAEPRVRAVLRRVPLWHRVARLRTGALVGAMAVVAAVSMVGSWSALRRPSLMVMQSAASSIESALYMTTALDVGAFGPQVRNTVPSMIVSVGKAVAGATRSTVVHVRSLSSNTRIVAGDSAPVVDGAAAFNRLRFLSTDSITVFRFEADGFRPVDISVRRAEVDATPTRTATRWRLAGGALEGHALDVRSPSITIQQGDSIRGTVEIEYSSPLVAASVWLSMTPSWGDPRTEGHDVTPLVTPVQRDLIKLPLALRGPAKPGHYWVLYLMAAEPSGGFALSQTNWTVERPLWGDGNDVALLPDSIIRRANAEGYVDSHIAYPPNWNVAGLDCEPREYRPIADRARYCMHRLTLLGIEVLVK